MANEMVAPILSYEDINNRAAEFLKDHERGDTLPVDIDSVAEFDLGLNIFPFPAFKRHSTWKALFPAIRPPSMSMSLFTTNGPPDTGFPSLMRSDITCFIRI